MSTQDYSQFPQGYGPNPPRPPVARGSRLPSLLLLLGGLVFLLILPTVAEQLQYSITRGKARAEAEAARELLADIPEGISRYRLAAKAVEPSVVGVRIVRLVNRNDEWSPIARSPLGAMEGQGSGVIVDTEGYIITNFHVVAQADQVIVTLSDGRTFKNVTMVGKDPGSDLAVLKIDASGLVASPWGNSDALEVGDQVLAIGSPYGLTETVTSGIVSAKQRRNLPVPGDVRIQDFLQTDAAVNPGNSGGPLVNLNGEIVGINTAIFGERFQGISFAIPSRLAQDVYRRLRAGETIVPGWLGVQMSHLSDQVAEQLGIKETRGVLIQGVVSNSPAEKAGIEPGDVVVEWQGTPVNDEYDLRYLVAGSKVGANVKIKIMRKGTPVELTVTIGERPSQLGR